MEESAKITGAPPWSEVPSATLAQDMTTAEIRLGLRPHSLVPTLAATAWLSTVLLILVGSVVRVTGHGLGCPDWPLCYGRAIPPAFGGAWVEFSHRLFGGIAGVQIVLLAALAWREGRDRPWSYRPAAAAAGLLAIQVLLGGLHVSLELPPETGLVHTGVAMLIVGLLAAQLAVSSPRLDRLREGLLATQVAVSSPRIDGVRASPQRAEFGRNLGIRLLLLVAATYALLLTGSAVTRSGASLACLSFPQCGAETSVSQPLVEIHMLHRFMALAVLILSGWIIGSLLSGSRQPALRRYTYALAIVLALQAALGVANVVLLLPMWSRVLHLTLAAVFWSGVVILWAATTSQSAHAAAQVKHSA